MRKQMMKGIFAVLAAISLAVLGGCSGGGEAKSGAGAKAEAAQDEKSGAGAKAEAAQDAKTGSKEAAQADSPAAAEGSEDIDPEVMDIIKYNIYVEMNNYMVELLENVDSYYLVVEYADEFAFVPNSGYDYKFDIHYLNTDIIDDALAVSVMEPSYGTLDELAVQAAEPMRALMEGFNKINKSYDFADNQYAKAKEYHAEIQNNVESFETAAYAFMEEISILGSERLALEEQKMLDEGRLIIYNCSHAITIGNQILAECHAQGVTDANITELDLTNIRPLYEELTAVAAAYDEAVSDNNQIMKESLSNSTPFDGLLNSLAQSVEWMIMQVESGKPIEDPGQEYLGGIIHIQVVLSQCIERYNTVFTE